MTSETYILSLDQGTTSSRSLLIDKNGKVQKVIDGMPGNSELLEFIKNLK